MIWTDGEISHEKNTVTGKESGKRGMFELV